MTDRIYLEVDKSNGAIMGLVHHPRESASYDFVEVTETELNYLNSLEDHVLPAGMITTLSDLLDFRKLKQESKIKAAQAAVAKAAQAQAAAKVKVVKVKAELDLFMESEAAKRGVSRAELEALLEARQNKLANPATRPAKAASNASNTNPSPSDDKARQSLIQQIKTRKYK
ncbi:hypothetical protein [Pseudomonas sp. R5(2019)]|uniref:hypothetical protein n=1 Tax=Pseudomonas sp. R5(2019) TaxID=2697566 RepID=UPI001411CB74|nr:hypothetical protein [Pseudomonas sp. R5(2019)]NBA94380.1 hypothetical protein [Pseudomonas sp. R5(2019)]